MKKFKFTLDKLLDYKDQILDKEKNDLAALNMQRAEAVEHKEQLQQHMKNTQDDFNARAAKGISPVEMAMFNCYHESLRMSISDTEREIEQLSMAVEKQTGVVVEASKEVSSLEKLEEKQLEAYRFKVAKADEAFIEEYVNSASVRAAIAANQ